MSKKPIESGRPDPYQIDKLAKIPGGVKIGILQFWLAGASFLLTVLGLPQAFDWLDRLVMLWLVLTIAVEFGQNAIVSWMDRPGFDAKRYLTHEINRKSALSIVATAVYALVVVLGFHGLMTLWVGLNLPTIGDLISESTADPISFGLWYLLIATIWRWLRTKLKRPIGRL
jgi:phosphatidylglycerophosphate synthase